MDAIMSLVTEHREAMELLERFALGWEPGDEGIKEICDFLVRVGHILPIKPQATPEQRHALAELIRRS